MTPPAVLRALGVGCRRGCPAEAIRALLAQALAECGLAHGDLHRVASIDTKADESGLVRLAEELRLPLSLWSREALQAFGARLRTPSTRVRAAAGVDGVAEAAALAAVTGGDPLDTGARLILPRRASEQATIAIACRAGDGVK